MRILMVNTVFPPAYSRGGPPRVNFRLAKALIEIDKKVRVLTSNSTVGSWMLRVTKDFYENIPVTYLPVYGPARYYFSPLLVSSIFAHRNKFDICLLRGHWTFFSITTALICRLLGKPFVVYPEGCLDHWALQYRGIKKKIYWAFIERYVYKWASRVVALTQAEVAQIREIGIGNSVSLIPNGIDPEEFSISNDVVFKYLPPDLRDKKIVLFFSRIHPKKGLDLLVEAFAVIHVEVPDALLLIAGPVDDEDYERRIRFLVTEYGLEHRVKFMGIVTGEMRLALLNAANVFVLPSYSEGMPLAILEAAVSGTPIVISSACNVPEIPDGGGGVLIDLTPSSIAEGILEVIGDQKRNEEMSLSAQRIVLDMFTWKRVAERTASMCERLIQK